MANSSDAPHTRESERTKKLVEELRFELRNTDDPLKDRAKMLGVSPLLLSRAADEIERRISTPIPLTPSDAATCKTCKGTETLWDGEFNIQCPKCAPITPSDEMVAAAQAAYVEAWEYGISDDDMRAALNLMGGEK